MTAFVNSLVTALLCLMNKIRFRIAPGFDDIQATSKLFIKHII